MRPRKNDERWQLQMDLTHDRADENGHWQPLMRDSYGSSVTGNATAEWFAQMENDKLVTQALLDRLRLEVHQLVDDLFDGKLYERGDLA